MTVKIVDPLTGGYFRVDESGEICVKGPTLMLGYIGVPLDETLDAEGFFPRATADTSTTRDRLYWEGRLTDIIKTGGANVSPLEVDEALATHPGVKLAKTVGLPHEKLGEVVVACVVPHEGAQHRADESGLSARATGELQGAASCALRLREDDRAHRQRQDQVGRASRVGGHALGRMRCAVWFTLPRIERWPGDTRTKPRRRSGLASAIPHARR